MSQTAKITRSWQVAFLALCAAAGCAAKRGIPPDPLFVARKPIEAQARPGPPVAVAFSEPAMPLDPVTALAQQKQGKAVPGVLTSHPRPDTPGPRNLPSMPTPPPLP